HLSQPEEISWWDCPLTTSRFDGGASSMRRGESANASRGAAFESVLVGPPKVTLRWPVDGYTCIARSIRPARMLFPLGAIRRWRSAARDQRGGASGVCQHNHRAEADR